MFQVFAAPENELTQYTNVIVDGRTSLIVDASGSFVREQADEAMFWIPGTLVRSYWAGSTPEEEQRKRGDLLAERAAELHAQRGDLRTLDPNEHHIFMLHPFGHHAFGHLFDSLQRLHHALPATPEPWKVLHSGRWTIAEFEVYCEKLGVRRDRLMEIVRNEAVVVPSLWVSPWQAFPAKIAPASYDWIYERYTRDVPKTEPTRLYLSRNHVRLGERGVLNEDEVLAHLNPLGFQTFNGTETVSEMLTLFHNAEMVVAPHGSALANTMFCKAGCRILEFCAENRVDYSFLRKHKKASYYRQVLCPGDEKFNISIPIDELNTFMSDRTRSLSARRAAL